MCSGTVTLGNTIVAGNTATTSGPDASGTFASQGHNLIGKTDGSTGWVGSDLTGTIAAPLNPLLAPLGNYGGPTQTMALLPGSPAIDAGSNALIPGGVTTDQRGDPRIVNSTVDIGAFDEQGYTLDRHCGKRSDHECLHGVLQPRWPSSVTPTTRVSPVNGGAWSHSPRRRSGASAALSTTSATIAGGYRLGDRPRPTTSLGSYTVTRHGQRGRPTRPRASA